MNLFSIDTHTQHERLLASYFLTRGGTITPTPNAATCQSAPSKILPTGKLKPIVRGLCSDDVFSATTWNLDTEHQHRAGPPEPVDAEAGGVVAAASGPQLVSALLADATHRGDCS